MGAKKQKLPSRKDLHNVLGQDPEPLGVKDVEQVFRAHLFANADWAQWCSKYSPYIFAYYSGVPYYRPDGWWQFKVQPWCPNWGCELNFDDMSDWPVAYHGTSCDNITSILRKGLRKPGEHRVVQRAHGAAYAGRNGARYVTPSLWYASHPVYSTFQQDGPRKWIQAVLKLRIRPKSYRVKPGSLRGKHWDRDLRFDPNFPTWEGLEWLLEGDSYNSSDAVIVGLMIRELGPDADRHTFGTPPPSEVWNDCRGPEYAWTEYLQTRFEEAGYFVSKQSRISPQYVIYKGSQRSNVYTINTCSKCAQISQGWDGTKSYRHIFFCLQCWNDWIEG